MPDIIDIPDIPNKLTNHTIDLQGLSIILLGIIL
jgi:hypothetical protein